MPKWPLGMLKIDDRYILYSDSLMNFIHLNEIKSKNISHMA
jgi:hypothetical protein